MTPELQNSAFPECLLTGWTLLFDQDNAQVFVEPC